MKIERMTKGLGILLLAGWSFTSAGAWADPGAGWGQPGRGPHLGQSRAYVAPGWRIDALQARQGARIRQGLRTGALRPEEARRLWREQRVIRRLERRFRADGHLSRAEYLELKRHLEAASRHIYAAKHLKGHCQPFVTCPSGATARPWLG